MKSMLALIGLLVVVSGFLIFSGDGNQQTSTNNANDGAFMPDETIVRPNDSLVLSIGEADAPVEIIKYMDYKCPLCNSLHRDGLAQVTESHVAEGNAKITFRNLGQLGPDSTRAAHASYCAAEQESFISFQDTVYDYMWDTYYSQGRVQEGEFSDVLTTTKMGEFADRLGMNAEQFMNCVDEEVYQSLVQSDQQLAARAGVSGTPSVVLDGQLIVGAQPFSIYNQLIRASL